VYVKLNAVRQDYVNVAVNQVSYTSLLVLLSIAVDRDAFITCPLSATVCKNYISFYFCVKL